ncbi:hypothetical protein MTO96_050826 [Rhipicephalus appendiculatus]
MIRRAQLFLRFMDMHDYMRLTGVVEAGVECNVRDDGPPAAGPAAPRVLAAHSSVSHDLKMSENLDGRVGPMRKPFQM